MVEVLKSLGLCILNLGCFNDMYRCMVIYKIKFCTFFFFFFWKVQQIGLTKGVLQSVIFFTLGFFFC
jgi:hypothetical protein